MSAQRLCLILFVLFTGMGCDREDESCTDAAPIVPGCGLSANDLALALGQPFDEVEQAFGAPAVVRDHGPLGSYFSYPDAAISGFHADGVVTVVTAEPGFEGATAGGVGIGASADAVDGEFGGAETDAVLGGRWVRAEGIGFEIAHGEVTRIQVFAPGS